MEAKVGLKFWWYKHSRTVLTMQIVRVTKKHIYLKWEHYIGLIVRDEADNGIVTWTRVEFDKASKKEYKEPLTEKDLKGNEELCKTCQGSYFEKERDSDMLPCIWCNFNGKREKTKEAIVTESQRSPLHPIIPIEDTK